MSWISKASRSASAIFARLSSSFSLVFEPHNVRYAGRGKDHQLVLKIVGRRPREREQNVGAGELLET
jgi:hypothetical protein